MSITNIAGLLADFATAQRDISRRGRGVTAVHGVNAAVSAVSGEFDDSANLRGRMARDAETVGYIFVNGWKASAKEIGTSRGPGSSPIFNAAQSVAGGGWGDSMGDLAEELLS